MNRTHLRPGLVVTTGGRGVVVMTWISGGEVTTTTSGDGGTWAQADRRTREMAKRGRVMAPLFQSVMADASSRSSHRAVGDSSHSRVPILRPLPQKCNVACPPCPPARCPLESFSLAAQEAYDWYRSAGMI